MVLLVFPMRSPTSTTGIPTHPAVRLLTSESGIARRSTTAPEVIPGLEQNHSPLSTPAEELGLDSRPPAATGHRHHTAQ